ICVDPRCREYSAGGWNLAGSGNGFAGGQCAEILVALDSSVKFAEEGAPVARVVFPGVFAVEEKTNGERLIRPDSLAETAHSIVEIGGGRLGIHAAVDEANEVGQVVVAKQPRDAVGPHLYLQGVVEAVGICMNA